MLQRMREIGRNKGCRHQSYFQVPRSACMCTRECVNGRKERGRMKKIKDRESVYICVSRALGEGREEGKTDEGGQRGNK
jgi:hypothetical protein